MKTLIWSVAWGDYSYMLQSLVKSIRDVGIDHDILVYSDKPIVGCKRLEMMKDIELDQTQYWKFEYLKHVARLDYDIFVFIDSDHYFVSKPRIDFSEIIGSDLWHSFLESPINSQETTRSDWWNIKNEEMAKIWKFFGVNQKIIYNTNGGFWICRKNFATKAIEVVYNFREMQKRIGKNLPEEVAIAVLSHMFSVDYKSRMHENYIDIWGSEWTGALKDKLPEGMPWKFIEYMTGKESVINPSIVHAMRSKNALIKNGKKILNEI